MLTPSRNAASVICDSELARLTPKFCIVLWEFNNSLIRGSFDGFDEADAALWTEQGGEPDGRIRQNLFTLCHDRKRLIIKSPPHVKTMFLDPIMGLPVSSGCSLASQSPSLLIDGDAVVFVPALSLCQFECRDQRADAAPKNHDIPSPRRITTGWFHVFPLQSRSRRSSALPQLGVHVFA
ncbi:MAG TPA: hypothetical protein PK472_15435 [Pseudomonadota bacterium]|nr:hypothetical protein [Pseudomonadota bacterium]HNN54178.1 hypothetical protein [Pseudomonadota bacterium]